MASSPAVRNTEIDCLSPEAQRLAEARLAAKRAARAEAREIRLRELERQQKEVEERPEKDFTEKGSRNMPSLSAATLASLGGTPSRRGSGDTSVSIDTETSIREIKDSLAEVEEKYKKAMVSNAQLDNEKTNFMYQVDTLKDTLLELEEQLAESRRQYEEKSKELEREKHAHSVLQFQFAEVKEALKQREEMLEEIRQLQHKQAAYIREISDLQETIEWKDKKIGALERQKEFFDSVRSERDDLRDEVAVLQQELKKHGIILNSEIATNGETSAALTSLGHRDSAQMTKEELHALKPTGDGTLGRANDVEVTKEMVADVGKGEITQDAEHEQYHRGDRGKDCVNAEESQPGDSTQDQKTSEDKASSPEASSADTEEQVATTPDDRTRASLEGPECLGDSGSESRGPVAEQPRSSTPDAETEREESAEKQKKDEQEDFKTNLGEASTEPCQEAIPLHVPEVDRANSTDTRAQLGSPPESVVKADTANVGQQVGLVASGPPEDSKDPGNQDENHSPNTARSFEKELAHQEEAKLKEAPTGNAEVGREHEGEDDTESVGESPSEVQTVPCSAAAESSQEKAAETGKVDTGSEPADPKEPDDGKSCQPGETLDSSPRKAKSKKKKNKKKKSPVSIETHNEAKEEPAFQNTDFSDIKEEVEAQSPDGKPAGDATDEQTKNMKPKLVAGSSDDADCPESPQVELDGELDREGDNMRTEVGKGGAGRDGSVSSAELDGRASQDDEGTEGAAESRPGQPDGEVGESGPSREVGAAPRTAGAESCVTSEPPSEAAEEVLGNDSLEDAASAAPAGEAGDGEVGGKEDARGGSEKGRGKEDCTMS